MNPDAWRRISDVFSDCVKRSIEDREQFLADLDRTQPEVVREVRELLATYEQDQSFLEHPGIDRLTNWETITARFSASGGPAAPRENAAGHWFKHKPRAFWVLLAADVIALGLYIFGGVLIHRYGPVTTTLGWDAALDGRTWKVDSVDVPGPAANKLKPGDILTTIDGKLAGGTLGADLQSIRPGSTYTLRVLRKGAGQEFVLKREIVPVARGTAGTFSYLLVSVAFFLTAVLVGFLKPDQRIAQLAWAALMTEGLTLLKVVLVSYVEFLRGLPLLVFQVLQLVDGPHFALAYHFYSRAFAQHIKKWRTPLVVLYVLGVWAAIHRLLLMNRTTLSFLVAHSSFTSSAEFVMGLFYMFARTLRRRE